MIRTVQKAVPFKPFTHGLADGSKVTVRIRNCC